MIRIATPDDAEAVRAIYAPYVTGSVTSFEEVVPSTDELRTRMVNTLRTHPWLVCVLDDAVAGYAYGCRHRARAAYRWSVETAVYVHDAHHRKGIARALYEKLFELLRAQGYCHAFAGITLPNDPSVRFHEALGFAPIGVFPRIGYKFDAWRDVGWWSRALREPTETPAEPVPFAEMDAV